MQLCAASARYLGFQNEQLEMPSNNRPNSISLLTVTQRAAAVQTNRREYFIEITKFISVIAGPFGQWIEFHANQHALAIKMSWDFDANAVRCDRFNRRARSGRTKFFVFNLLPVLASMERNDRLSRWPIMATWRFARFFPSSSFFSVEQPTKRIVNYFENIMDSLI